MCFRDKLAKVRFESLFAYLQYVRNLNDVLGAPNEVESLKWQERSRKAFLFLEEAKSENRLIGREKIWQQEPAEVIGHSTVARFFLTEKGKEKVSEVLAEELVYRGIPMSARDFIKKEKEEDLGDYMVKVLVGKKGQLIQGKGIQVKAEFNRGDEKNLTDFFQVRVMRGEDGNGSTSKIVLIKGE